MFFWRPSSRIRSTVRYLFICGFLLQNFLIANTYLYKLGTSTRYWDINILKFRCKCLNSTTTKLGSEHSYYLLMSKFYHTTCLDVNLHAESKYRLCLVVWLCEYNQILNLVLTWITMFFRRLLFVWHYRQVLESTPVRQGTVLNNIC